MIRYITGSVLEPQGTGEKFIVHVCNDAGGWGKGFTGALSHKWPQPEALYRERKKILGTISWIQVETNITVVNMMAQHRYSSPFRPAIRYRALEDCLINTRDLAKWKDASIHMPRIGCGLGGGTWKKVEKIIQAVFRGHSIPVFVYDITPFKEV